MFSHSVIEKNLLTIVTVTHGFAARKRPCAAAFKRAKKHKRRIPKRVFHSGCSHNFADLSFIHFTRDGGIKQLVCKLFASFCPITQNLALRAESAC